MSMANTLTRSLYEPDIDPREADEFLRETADVSATYQAARIYGNSEPRPPKKRLYDMGLRGTDTQAYYIDPKEVKSIHPIAGMQLEAEIGPDPIVAYNPDILKGSREYRSLVDQHEKTHGGQQGKLKLKDLHVRTSYGELPIGLMLVEGGVEWATEKRGKKAVTRYRDEKTGRKSEYSIYRDFVYELEEKSHGILRQIYRAADRAGPYAAARLLQTVPGISQLLEKYAMKLNAGRSEMKLAA